MSSLNRNMRKLRDLVDVTQIAFVQYEEPTMGHIVWQVWEVEHHQGIGKYILRWMISDGSSQEVALKKAVRRLRTTAFHVAEAKKEV